MTAKRLGWLMGLILICSLTLNQPPKGSELDLISDIRQWAFQHKLWPNLSQEQDHTSLIAVREVYQIEQAQLLLRVYLLTPCRNLCGVGENCARHCQKLIKEWKGNAVNARLLIEGFDLKNNRSLGRVTLKTIAPVTLRYWSRRQKLIALTQEVSAQDHRLHLLQLVNPTEVDHLQEIKRSEHIRHQVKSPPPSPLPPQVPASSNKASSNKMLTLRYYDNLSLGPFSGLSNAREGATNFVDLDGDQKIELIAPFKNLVHLTPLPIAVPTPYRFTAQGLIVDTKLISATSPSISELRAWILKQHTQKPPDPKSSHSKSSFGSSQQQLVHTIMQAKVIYIYAAQLCLKSLCDEGEKLVHFAYPQHQVVLRVWKQLREYILNSIKRNTSAHRSPNPHPFSTLDQASTSQRPPKIH